MKNFFINLKNDISLFLKKHAILLIFLCLSLIIGIAFAIFSILSDVSFLSVLSSGNKLFFKFVTGEGSYFTIFFNKILEFIFVFAIIFLFNLSIYSSFLSFVFVAYQGFLLTVTCSNIVSVYSIAGIINVAFLIVPINVLWFVVVFSVIMLTFARASDASKYNLNLKTSFMYSKIMTKISLCFICAIIVSLLFSFILPLLLKSFIMFFY